MMNLCGRNKKYDYNLIINFEIVVVSWLLIVVVFFFVGGREIRLFIS